MSAFAKVVFDQGNLKVIDDAPAEDFDGVGEKKPRDKSYAAAAQATLPPPVVREQLEAIAAANVAAKQQNTPVNNPVRVSFFCFIFSFWFSHTHHATLDFERSTLIRDVDCSFKKASASLAPTVTTRMTSVRCLWLSCLFLLRSHF